MRRVTQLLTAATSGSGVMNAADVGNANRFAVYVTFNAATSAGSVIVETAPDKNYAGTWHPVATIAWAAATRTHYQYIDGPLGALRTRVVSVTGGTVDSFVVSNN